MHYVFLSTTLAEDAGASVKAADPVWAGRHAFQFAGLVVRWFTSPRYASFDELIPGEGRILVRHRFVARPTPGLLWQEASGKAGPWVTLARETLHRAVACGAPTASRALAFAGWSALGLGCAVACCWALRGLLRWGRVFDVANQVCPMTGEGAQPFCAHCQAPHRDIFAEKDDMTMKFYWPRHCSRCAWFPRLWGTVRMTIGISADDFRSCSTWSALRAVKSRDIATAQINRFDDRRGGFSVKHCFLQHHFGTLEKLQRRLGWVYTPWTRSLAWASLWYRSPLEEKVPPPADGDDGPGRRYAVLSRLWSWTDWHSGLYPQLVHITPQRPDSEDLAPVASFSTMSTTTPASTFHATTAEPNIGLTPPPGEEVGLLADPTCVRIGPVLQAVSVWARSPWSNRWNCIRHRTMPKERYRKDSETARRLGRFMRAFNDKVFSRERVERAYARLEAEAGDRGLYAFVTDKFSEEQVRQAAESLEVGERPPPRKGTVKLEVVAKQGKAARAVVDEGLHALVINAVLSHIFEDLLFGELDGIFHSWSIKHRDRLAVLREIKDRWNVGAVKCAALEVDQTAMELHERVNYLDEGVLSSAYAALGKIAGVVHGKLLAIFTNHAVSRMFYDKDGGISVYYEMDDKPQTRRRAVRYNGAYMTSGWRLTSAVNFINELSATLACMVANPEVVLKQKKETRRFFVQDPDNVPRFESLDVPGSGFPLRLWVEGDDVVGSVDRRFMEFQPAIEARYAELGYKAKLKFVTDGRAEFVGAHLPLKEGKPAGDWCPDVARYLSKLGVMAGQNITAETMSARCISLAAMFRGSLPRLGQIFLRLGEHHMRRSDRRYIIRPEAFSVEAAALGGAELTLGAFYDKLVLELNAVGRSPAEELDMLCLSVTDGRAVITMDEYSKLCDLATVIEPDMDDALAYTFLPFALR